LWSRPTSNVERLHTSTSPCMQRSDAAIPIHSHCQRAGKSG
jgi:hypothetical protein